jgi:tetratricopeptide (TPR) repeat protein
MSELGEVLKVEGDLQSARQQYQAVLEASQKIGDLNTIEESRVALADLALEEGHPYQAEPILSAAIAQFEKEKADPDTISAYTILSRALLLQSKLKDSRNAIEHAAELGRSSPDPALTLPIAYSNSACRNLSGGPQPSWISDDCKRTPAIGSHRSYRQEAGILQP